MIGASTSCASRYSGSCCAGFSCGSRRGFGCWSRDQRARGARAVACRVVIGIHLKSLFGAWQMRVPFQIVVERGIARLLPRHRQDLKDIVLVL